MRDLTVMAKAKYKELRAKVKAECAESPAFQKWLSEFDSSTPITYGNNFYRFILHLREKGGQFSEYSPDDLIQFQKNAVGDDRYLLLDEAQEFCQNMRVKSMNEEGEGRDARLKTKRNQYRVICSFFQHNRAPFPRKTFYPSSETEPVRKDLVMAKAKYKELRAKVKAECAESPAFQKWLSKFVGSTPIAYGNNFYRFILHLREKGGQFSEYSPDDLIQFQKNAVGDDRYLLLDEAQEFSRNMKVKSMNEEGEGRDARLESKRSQYTAICSFFQHNRAPFPKETFSPSSETPPVRKDLTLTNVRDVILSSNHTYAAILLCMFMGGMGKHELVYWSNHGWEDLKKEIAEGRSTYKVYVAGRKGRRNIKPFYSRVGGDAVDYLLRYINGNRKKAITSFERAKKRGDIPINEEFNSNVIFYTSHGTPISKNTLYQYWIRRLFALGIITPVENPTSGTRYDNNMHQLRSLFRTQWGKSPPKGFIAEALMGHVVDPNDYLRTQNDLNWVAREYRRALPFLNIMSSVKPYDLYEEEEVEAIRDENKERIDELEARLDRTLEDIKTGKYDAEMMERKRKADLIERIRKTKSDLK